MDATDRLVRRMLARIARGAAVGCPCTGDPCGPCPDDTGDPQPTDEAEEV